MFKHLLVPTDGSLLSDKAVERAVSFAKHGNLRLLSFLPFRMKVLRYTVRQR